MSYAIVRNEKLTRKEANGSCIHNDRRTKRHTNKDIDPSRTHLNYYIKKNEMTYVKEFDKLREKYDLKGKIRSNSIVVCEMMFTSDNDFFNKIGESETRRYFEECYKFVCNYKNLGERNIISATVHLDEDTPHLHLIYVPVVKTKDKAGNDIEKICCKDFWRSRESYRKLQDDFCKYVNSKGFKLERGLPVEETGAKNLKIEELKKITNYENTKKVSNKKLELPELPEITDYKKLTFKRDEKILNEIINPQNKIIDELYAENVSLHKELSKQVNLINEAEKYQKERDKIIADNEKLDKEVEKIKKEYSNKSNNLDSDYNTRKQELEKEFKDKSFDIEYKYKNKIRSLEKENLHLYKVIDKFGETIEKFIKWICNKFNLGEAKELVKEFEKENNTLLDAENQIKKEERKKEFEYEL